MDSTRAFNEACQNGNLKLAKELYETNKIDIHFNNESAFKWSCRYGQIEIAKWLLTLDGKIDIHSNNDEAFRWCCSKGHIEIAKWLLTLDKFDNRLVCDYIKFKNNGIYRYLFRKDYRPTNEFMQTKYKEYLKNNNHYLKIKIRSMGRLIHLFNKTYERLYQPLAPGYKLAESSFNSIAKV